MMRDSGKLDASAYWISDSEFYFAELQRNPFLQREDIEKMFEWRYTDQQLFRTDEGRDTVLEEKYAQGNLWDAILADRRLMYGDIAKSRQSYASKFSHQQLKAIIYSALEAIERKIEAFKPDAIVTFVPATFGDYLLAMVAARYQIPYLQLRSSKVRNFVFFAESISAAPKTLVDTYNSNLSKVSGYLCESEAEEFITEGAARPIDYEGTISRGKPPLMVMVKGIVRQFAIALRKKYRPANRLTNADNHTPPPLKTWLHASLLIGWHKSRALEQMQRRTLDLSQAGSAPFLFYPLHSEPEIALSVYGRDHQNQIETVRRLAQSIPLNWRLVIKEHPRTVGYRKPDYYRKLLEIPNVWFADPDTRPFFWLESASAVATVSGFVGFEALMVGKPVLVLGDASFSVLPETMVRKIGALSDVASELRDLLVNFKQDNNILKAFVAACMSVGCSVNLYSELLAKPGRNSAASDTVEAQYQRLVDVFLRALEVEK